MHSKMIDMVKSLPTNQLSRQPADPTGVKSGVWELSNARGPPSRVTKADTRIQAKVATSRSRQTVTYPSPNTLEGRVVNGYLHDAGAAQNPLPARQVSETALESFVGGSMGCGCFGIWRETLLVRGSNADGSTLQRASFFRRFKLTTTGSRIIKLLH